MGKRSKVAAAVDYDPEDEYFGDDGTRAKKTSSKREMNYLDDLDFLKARLDEEGLGKGLKTSRKELGMLSQEDASEAESWKGELEDDFEFVDNQNSADEESASSGAEEFVIRKQPRVTDYERGQQVKNQLNAWDDVLTLRMKLQPLLNAVDDLEAKTSRSQRRQLLCMLESLNDDLQSFLSSDLCTEAEQITSQLLQNVSQVYAENHTPALNLKIISKSGWQQVCDIFSPSSTMALSKLRSRAFNAGSYSDGDFYQSLLREWAERTNDNLTGVMGVLVLRKERKHREGVDPRASKGRKINYEVHERLCNFMVPRRSAAQWSDAKIDDFFRSIIGAGN